MFRCRISLVFFIFFILTAKEGGSQPQEEKKESEIDSLTRDVLRVKERAKRLSLSVETSVGYETNVLLGKIRKGDIVEEFLASAYYFQPLGHRLWLNAGGDVNVMEYNEITDVSNILNHLRIGLNASLNKFFTLGAGYDFSGVVYPESEESGFLFHKNFIYLRHKFSKTTYQQLQLEQGWKNFLKAKAFADSLDTIQDEERQDQRQSVEYSWASSLTSNFYLRWRARYLLNDSNAQFQEFYDYHSMDLAQLIQYKWTPDFSLNWNFNVTLKDYDGRYTTVQTKKEKDDLYATTLGLRYNLRDNESLALSYTYRQAVSNDPAAEYTGSAVKCGWRYNF